MKYKSSQIGGNIFLLATCSSVGNASPFVTRFALALDMSLVLFMVRIEVTGDILTYDTYD